MSETHVFVDAEEMAWRCMPTRGVSFKSLQFDKDTKAGAVMIHMCPGTTYPSHHSERGQAVFVVDGELVVGDRRLGRGSYGWLPANIEHKPSTEEGCVLYVTFAGAVHHASDAHGLPA
jgi:quercetin dioxygenase-like cupin family protein